MPGNHRNSGCVRSKLETQRNCAAGISAGSDSRNVGPRPPCCQSFRVYIHKEDRHSGKNLVTVRHSELQGREEDDHNQIDFLLAINAGQRIADGLFVARVCEMCRFKIFDVEVYAGADSRSRGLLQCFQIVLRLFAH